MIGIFILRLMLDIVIILVVQICLRQEFKLKKDGSQGN
ncbi:hypothetical protein DSBG_3001 [Desulfosporosinus sp. BG]|nr:hypothetical protein DSBG_3001 [Desulfosporosinus sp. BG]